ncbi:DNA-binding SARP family transcriptional activator/uncharacterized protein (UPF0333 family) [Dysgonomonas sp. PFB1-18]|uniref:hypothetical protein n=1 Tax=unclassified Dysgonomonas TaxID=2630389 RepID=UPI002473D49D|nr:MULTISPECIES: hypothetical protein [unclassified Dysgonomonas]MDH6308675.1 DNA-binding SARP family transcriptional activator/uncharacterized protein (UPF0333 family) [Dysgonomonas sp. PF1-14]MDH6338628.1 DNA-binding SARP family transcriptional activator/uncharacterized protein (UPF0333 family) [Dysgonomonas sp. PF1-16]MDH6379924.1 DNA-binding SARP family transcriptional activator/uncharacterized protein (UPF0333 family) [Dysgonomonas sp. PFB1-18]MDH6397456.1 DNA-binding SARP family transcrip
MRKILLIILILTIFLWKINVFAQINEQSHSSGLTFTAHTKNQDERTGLNLTAEKPMRYSKEGFSIEFDLRLREELHTYGYVCRIVSNDSESFDVISYLLESKLKFLLTKVDKVVETTSIQDSVSIAKDRWIKVKLSFDKANIKIQIDNKEQTITQPITEFSDIKIYFGTNRNIHFYTNDVPPMTIRNIIIKDNKDTIIHKWELSTHNKDEVYDEITKSPAIAENPVWEIDKHTRWSKIASFTLNTDGTNINPLPQITYDSITGKVFIVTRDRIYTYHLDSNRTDTIIPQKGYPYFRVGSSSQLVYDNKQNKLISYNPDLPKLNFFDFDKKEWSEQSIVEVDTRQHHNRFIDHKNNRLVVFGGYGIHRYNAQLSTIDISDTAKWNVASLDSIIQPRYLSALCNLDEKNIMILGGYGSASGKQEESPRNYYDLYKINVDTKEYTRLWSFVNDKNHYTFSNSLIADVEANKIYALTYNNDRYYSSLYLSSFDINTEAPSIHILSDSIKYNFLDIKSYCDLFLYQKTSALYALVQQESASGESTVIDIYSLAFPPLSKDFIQTYEASKKENKSLLFLLLIAIVIFLLSLAYIYYRKKNKLPKIDLDENKDIEQYSKKEKPKTELQKSAIYLLGGFRIYDKDGENVTGEFSPTIKQIMIYLLLNSIKNDKGTTSQRLDETFWFGMDKDSAANNRRVNIRKLRLLLQDIGDVEIINKNSYWYLNLGEHVTCDYSEVSLLINQFDRNFLDKNTISRIVATASAGPLLPNINEEWADDYKSDFSTKLVDVLLEIINKPEVKDDPKLLLKISDVILIHDSIDEEAIRIKCRVLYQMKQKGLSKQSYDKFCEDYIGLLNTKPDFTYEDIIGDLTKN